ncbi:MAG: thioesterase domain-containing protein [Myxococcota bacterium]|nr:thioesterase domain-containing protein [Myxococcota bacterium]
MSLEIAEQVATFVRSRFRVPDDDPVFDHQVHLFDEGYVDSAGVVELVSHLEESYGIALPDDILFSEDFTTIAGIASIVAALRDVDAISPGEERSPADDRAIVELRGGSGAPLFCIGAPSLYAALAESVDGPVCSVDLPIDALAQEKVENDGTVSELPSIEESARAYVRAIRARGPGPYCLAGTAYGGILAYEIAQQLTFRGEQVELVALLETALPSALDDLAAPRRIAAQLRALVREGPALARAKLGLRGESSSSTKRPAELDPARDESIARVVARYERTMLPFAGRVVLYRADRSVALAAYDRVPDLGWARVVPQLEIVRIPCRDGSILRPPAVHRITTDLGARARAAAA